MTVDFSHLKTVQDDTKPYTLLTQFGKMILTVRRADEKNKKYFNEQLQRNKHLATRRQKIDSELFIENRNTDYRLYSQHVVVGWEGVVDAKGDKVPFSPSECEAFLRAIGDDEFENLRNFCRDYTNFDKVGAEATAGNSPTV